MNALGGFEVTEEFLVNEDLEPISELLLNFAARKEHVEKVIKPALNNGKIVIKQRAGFKIRRL